MRKFCAIIRSFLAIQWGLKRINKGDFSGYALGSFSTVKKFKE